MLIAKEDCHMNNTNISKELTVIDLINSLPDDFNISVDIVSIYDVYTLSMDPDNNTLEYTDTSYVKDTYESFTGTKAEFYAYYEKNCYDGYDAPENPYEACISDKAYVNYISLDMVTKTLSLTLGEFDEVKEMEDLHEGERSDLFAGEEISESTWTKWVKDRTKWQTCY